MARTKSKTACRKPNVSFSKEIAEHICGELAAGRSLRDVCRDDGMPTETAVRIWARDDKEGFFSQYARAREIGYHAMADELLEVADDGTNDWMERQDKEGKQMYILNGEHVQRSRLRLDTRKWLLSKALPKIYGDKVSVEAHVTSHEDALEELA